MGSRSVAVVVATIAFMTQAGATRAAEIKVLSSHAININEAYVEFTAMFEKASDHRVTTTFTTGWAGTPEITKRLQGGEMYDLVIGSRQLIDDMIKEGRLLVGNRVDIAKSGVGVAVRAGAPKPDIASTEAVKRALLAAKSIGYSTGPSGVYLVGLIQRLGLADEIKPKLRQTPGPNLLVGDLLARGEAELGFQQVSELLHFPGIQYVGPLPADIQETTVFSAALQPGAAQADAAKAFVRFITSPVATPVIRKSGMSMPRPTACSTRSMLGGIPARPQLAQLGRQGRRPSGPLTGVLRLSRRRPVVRPQIRCAVRPDQPS
jgi:molybdate transport system substrate-binding protein